MKVTPLSVRSGTRSNYNDNGLLSMALGRQRPGAEVPVSSYLAGDLLQGKVKRWAGTLQDPIGFMKKGAKDRGRVEDREDPCAFFLETGASCSGV